MRRRVAAAAAVLGVITIFAGLGSGTAAAGTKKLVEGTVYDTTCAVAGECGSPCPPPCGGPIPVPGTRADFVCAEVQRRIVCPLTQSGKEAAPDFCIQGLPCGVTYPVYSGEGAVVTLRKRGAESFLAKLPVAEGHFRVRLSPGEYVIRLYSADPRCWEAGPPLPVEITPKLRSPVPAALEVVDACAAEADAR